MTIPARLRFAILERDRFHCRYCGAAAPSDQLEVDHVQPRSKGGNNNPRNLVTACIACNQAKAARILDEIAADVILMQAPQLLAEIIQHPKRQADEETLGDILEACNVAASYGEWVTILRDILGALRYAEFLETRRRQREADTHG